MPQRFDFFRNARFGDNRLGLYIATLLVVFAGYFVGQLPLLGVMMYTIGQLPNNEEVLNEFLQSQDFSAVPMSSNLLFFLLMLMFVIAMGALWLMYTKVHRKPWIALFNTVGHIRWKRILLSFAVFMALQIVAEGIFYTLEPENYTWQFDASKFFILLPLALIFIPIQIAFEELLIRSYMLQGLSLITKSAVIPILITSIFFALLHGMNPEIGEFGFGKMMTYYFSVAVFLGVITVLDESIEPALGVHAAVNLYGSLAVSFSGSAIQTDTLVRVGSINIDYMLIGTLGFIAIYMMVMKRLFNWNDWEKLWSPFPANLHNEVV